ncbi:tryptophan synthase beta subunit-like PLP-dependent enzyme [Amylocarpus encephaloides]|uniref:Tryptophan synthase beta subunit-like PLP-dependent enzyme n=1 Tax=Amylocarpus encephaloides TaxID=45428 RepID=A0A9P7YGE1_9HELO|nr:tryptophan synthase beta subunit-like PLP-dependent enzyme [Amylocarpus encephaloides]
MAEPNTKNVYFGPDSLKNYFSPDHQPPLPLVEIPASLNPYLQDGLHIYAKMMSMHPANNVKAFPALNMLHNLPTTAAKTDTLVEYSSGSTVISMAITARILYGIKDVRAYVSEKTSEAKIRLMLFFGLGVTTFGGPSQPDPKDPRGGIQAAHVDSGANENIVNLNQYENENNWQAHTKWTAPQILHQLPQIGMVCAGMGTAGTLTGIGTFFKSQKPSVKVIGVCTTPNDRVPGPRALHLLQSLQFPWKSVVDEVEEVNSHDSFSMSLQLCRNGLVCGPSSGFNLCGLLKYLKRVKEEGKLEGMKVEKEVHAVFLCCDLPYQYIGEYFEKLGTEGNHFREVTKREYQE